MQVALPAGLDIFLLGAKTHDSEIRLARYLVHNLATGSEVLDIGAHFGFYSLLCAQLAGPQGRVLAVEASAATFAVLEKNLNATGNIQGLRAAASNAAGELIFLEFPLLYSEFNTLQSSPSEEEHYARGIKPRAIPTPAYRMDEVLETYRLSPAFIKIDVEGAEDRVIEGLSEWLERRPPAVVAMEYLAGRETDNYRNATAMLVRFGWQAFSITTTGNLCPCPDIEAYLKHSRLDSDNIIFQPLA
jgi:FkbM family methyltransferase